MIDFIQLLLTKLRKLFVQILILDNYDSFTYNLYHYCEQFCEELVVKRNDEIDTDFAGHFDKILLSPGPGLPGEAGIMQAVIGRYHRSIPILGVCLGLQGITEYFGGRLRNLPGVLHGVSSTCHRSAEDDPLFTDIPETFTIGHYHSWVADEARLPAELVVTSRNEDGLIMSMRHRHFPVWGVQFHPESIMTEHGLTLIRNWIQRCH